MYNIETGDIIEVRIKYVQSSQQLLNVFHYRYDGPTTITDGPTALQNLLTAVETDPGQWGTTWAAEATQEATIETIQGQVIFPLRRPYLGTATPIPGTSIDTALPQNTQLGLTKVGSTTGRGKTGRVEVPGAVVTMVSLGETTTLGAGWLSNLADAVKMVVVIGAAPDEVATPVIWRRGAPLTTEAITDVRAQRTVRVDHRRTVRVGK